MSLWFWTLQPGLSKLFLFVDKLVCLNFKLAWLFTTYCYTITGHAEHSWTSSARGRGGTWRWPPSLSALWGSSSSVTFWNLSSIWSNSGLCWQVIFEFQKNDVRITPTLCFIVVLHLYPFVGKWSSFSLHCFQKAIMCPSSIIFGGRVAKD